MAAHSAGIIISHNIEVFEIFFIFHFSYQKEKNFPYVQLLFQTPSKV